MLSPGFDDDERYVVCEITGYEIDRESRKRYPTTGYWVADRAYCYREVATFLTHTPRRTKERRRAAAYALADRLNAEDRAASLAP